MTDWSNYLREVCEQWMLVNNQQIGSLNEDLTAKEVEVDETKYFHRKYQRGRYRDGQWVFGGVELAYILFKECCMRVYVVVGKCVVHYFTIKLFLDL